MAGIYIHIPFCKQSCTYCNFHFTTSLRYKADVLDAIGKEIANERHYLGGEPVHTIYFGGGTPSLLSIEECQSIIGAIYANYPVVDDVEVTLETNPDDITEERLKTWKAAGINRLSIGVQSFFEEELRWMNRAHNAQQAITSLQLAVAHFDNITMDLIYGSPLLTDEMWQQNVQQAIASGIPHLSCYALTVEEKTPLHKQITSNKTPATDDEKQARQFLLLMQWLSNAGYEHYEVSNFAKPGYRSRHNSSYWKGAKYLGVGPSAHSFNGVERRWNIANNALYTRGISTGLPNRETEVLSANDKLNEFLMISLRTKEGLDLQRIEQTWGAEKAEIIRTTISVFQEEGLIHQNGNVYSLSDTGMLQADGIASELFFV